MDIVFVGETDISACTAPEERGAAAAVIFTNLSAELEVQYFLMGKSSCSPSLIQVQREGHEGSGR